MFGVQLRGLAYVGSNNRASINCAKWRSCWISGAHPFATQCVRTRSAGHPTNFGCVPFLGTPCWMSSIGKPKGNRPPWGSPLIFATPPILRAPVPRPAVTQPWQGQHPYQMAKLASAARSQLAIAEAERGMQRLEDAALEARKRREVCAGSSRFGSREKENTKKHFQVGWEVASGLGLVKILGSFASGRDVGELKPYGLDFCQQAADLQTQSQSNSSTLTNMPLLGPMGMRM